MSTRRPQISHWFQYSRVKRQTPMMARPSKARLAVVESLESRIAPATLDLTGGVLTFTLDANVTTASLSSGAGNLTFDAGVDNVITISGDAGANSFGDGGRTSTGSASGVTQILIVGGSGAGEIESFTLSQLDDPIAGIDFASSVDSVHIAAPTITLQDSPTNSFYIGGKTVLDANTILTTNKTLNDGAVTFVGTIDSPTHRSLRVFAGSAAITLGADIGPTDSLGNLTLNAGSISIGGDITSSTGGITLTAATSSLALGAHTLTAGGTAGITITASGVSQSAGGLLDASSGGSITIDASAGAVDLAGSAISGSNVPSAFSLSNASTVKLGNIDAQGGLLAGISISSVTGKLEQNTGTTIATYSVDISSTAEIDLTSSGNAFQGTVSLATIGASNISLRDANALLLGNVTTDSGIMTVHASAITTTGTLEAATASLTATASISLGGNVSTTSFSLTAGTNVIQTAGAIVGAAVSVDSETGINLVSTSNMMASFAATNSTSGVITVANGEDGFVIGGITNAGGAITVDNTYGALNHDATISGPVVRGGTNTNAISISTSGDLTVGGPISTAGSSGGTLQLTGAISLDSAPTLGGGNIILEGGAGTLRIAIPLTYTTSFSLSADGDIEIAAPITTTGNNSDLNIIADADHDGHGGIYITRVGSLTAGRDLSLVGSLLTSELGTAILVEADGINAQLLAQRNLTVSTSTEGAANVIALGGYLTSSNSLATGGNVLFAGLIELTEDVEIYAAKNASISFTGAVNSANHSNLALTTDLGTINFDAAIGASQPLGALDISNAYAINASASITTETFSVVNGLSSVTVAGALTTTGTSLTNVLIHTPSLTVSSVAAGNGGITWEINSLSLGGSLSGSRALTIAPISSARSIGLNGAGDLNISAVELAYFQDGFSEITIGRLDGSGTVNIGGVTFRDSLNLLSPSGTITVNDTLATTGTTSDLTITAKALNLTVDSANGTIPAISTEGASVTVSAAITLSDDTLVESSTGAIGGDITLTATINGSFHFKVDAYNGSGGGTVTFNGLPKAPGDASLGGGSALRSLVVDADTISLTPNTRTLGAQIYTANSLITTGAGSLISFANGNIQFDAPVAVPVNLRVITGADIIFNHSVDNTTDLGSGQLTLSAGGDITFESTVGSTHALDAVAVSGATLLTAASAFHVRRTLSLTLNEVDFGGEDTVEAGALLIQSATDRQAISLGGISETPNSNALELSHDDLRAIADGTSLITIGRPLTSSISIDGPVTFHDPLLLRVATRGTAAINIGHQVELDGDASFSLLGARTLLNANIVSTATGNIALNPLVLGIDALITTGTAAISLNGPVLSPSSNNLQVTSTNGNISFRAGVGNGLATARPGIIDIDTAGTVGLSRVDSLGLSVTANTINLAGNLTTRGANGINLSGQVFLRNHIAAQAYGGDLSINGDIDSPGNRLVLSFTAANVAIDGDVGSVFPLAQFNATAPSTTGTVSILGGTKAALVNIKANSIISTGLTETTGSQFYTSGDSVSLGAVTARTLAITSLHSISNTGAWDVSGRGALRTYSNQPSDDITITGAGNNFGDLTLRGHNATVVVDDSLKLALAVITQSGGLGGITSLTSAHGSIQQTGPVSTWKLNASAVDGDVIFNLGTLEVLQLGAITAKNDVSVVRGGPGNLQINGVISTDVGEVLIVANYGKSNASIRNLIGSNAIQADSIVLYSHSRSATALGSIPVTPFGSFLRFSPVSGTPGYPGNFTQPTIIYTKV